MPDEQEVAVEFPVAGVDATSEYARQPGGTTPVGVNVRALDQLTDRLRGGSRPGISKFIAAQVSGGNLIQHLTLLVDPTTAALGAGYGPGDPGDPDPGGSGDPLGVGDDGSADGYDATGAPLPGTTEDTSTNNLRERNPTGPDGPRRYRTGGSARQPTRKRPAPVDSEPISFVQAKREQPGIVAPPTFSVTLDDQPQAQSLLIVIVNCERIADLTNPPVPTVTCGDTGLPYTNVGGDGYQAIITSDGTDRTQVTMFYRVATAGVDEKTAIVTKGPEHSFTIYEVILLEYRHAASVGPRGNFSKAEDASQVTSQTIGPVNGNGSTGQLVIAGLSNQGTLMTSPTGQNKRAGVSGAPIGANMAVVDKLGVSGLGAVTLSVFPTTPVETCGIICEFHK